MRALLLALVLASPAVAQPVDLWLTVSPGALVASEADLTDDFLFDLSLQAARGPWVARLALVESAGYSLDFGSPSLAQTGGSPSDLADPEWFGHRTVVLAAGPRIQTGRLMASVTAGPAWTTDPHSSASALGLGVGTQTYLQLGGGAVWLGGEVNGVLNGGASHLGVGVGLRVDLRRAP